MLRFDFDDSEIRKLAADLNADDQQVKRAMNRALKRTAGTVRKRSSTGLQAALGLRSATALRRRIKEYRLGKGGNSVKLWYGVNDLPLSAFPGRAKQSADGMQVGGINIAGGFRIKGKSGIYVRTGRSRWDIREATVPIEDKARVFIEDEVFAEIPEILMGNFVRELRAYTILGVGNGR